MFQSIINYCVRVAVISSIFSLLLIKTAFGGSLQPIPHAPVVVDGSTATTNGNGTIIFVEVAK